MGKCQGRASLGTNKKRCRLGGDLCHPPPVYVNIIRWRKKRGSAGVHYYTSPLLPRKHGNPLWAPHNRLSLSHLL